jgi:hypothetical protein
LHLCDYLSREEDLALYLIKLVFPSPKDHLYDVSFKIDSGEEDLKKIRIVFLLSPLVEGHSPSLNKLAFSFPKTIYVKFGKKKNCPVVLEKKSKI